MNGPGIGLGPAAGQDLRWVVDVLWGGDAAVKARLGEPPQGARVLADLRALPNARRPRLLVPSETSIGRAALRAGMGTRGRRARVVRAAGSAAFRGPLARIAFRDRLVVFAEEEPDGSLGDLLAQVLGEPVAFSVNVRPPAPSRKPVLQILDRRGATVAYAKVAWHPFSDRSVANESAFLRVVAEHGGRVRAPSPIATTEWRGHPVVVTAPMPASLERLEPSADPPDPAFTREIAGLFGSQVAPYGESPLRTAWHRRLADVDAGPIRDAVAMLLDVLERGGGLPVTLGAWHGDWSPWNLAMAGDDLWAWDWEYGGHDVPLGLDLLHFAFQVPFVSRREGLGASLAHARARAAAGLEALGLDDEDRAFARAAHLVELTLRYLESEASGVAAPPRFTSQAVPVLRAEVDRVG